MGEQNTLGLWHNEMTMKTGAPDFLLIPKIVHDNPRLRPTDWVVYAVVYWYERLKDGHCFASNDAIGAIAGVGERAVMGGLDRLEKEGYIKRTYQDDRKTVRVGIETLVYFGVQKSETPPSGKMPKLPAKPATETPGDFARRFFSGDEKAIEEIMAAFAHVPDPYAVGQELRKFTIYWTEPTKNGKRQLWETKPTFEVKRRFYTWLNRASSTSNSIRRGAGSGITV